jgi:regulator of protease activity HflC (stomatin/prohibitin superfamily)
MWEVLLATAIAGVGLLLATRGVARHVIYEWEAGLLYVDGKFERTLAPGVHRLFRPFRTILVTRVSTIAQFQPSGLADVASNDGLPFRLAALVQFKVLDARAFSEGQTHTLLGNAMTVALADLAAGIPFAELQKDRSGLSARLLELIGQPCSEIEVGSASINQLIFPPETRRLLAEVEKARLEGLAALERARGENAALRSLANAARLLKNNPELTHLRLLQAVETSKGSSTIVLGQGSLVTGLKPEDAG